MNDQKTVLVVDDQSNWRDVFTSLLEGEYKVVCTESADAALRATLEQEPPFALAIIDIRLNDQDPTNEEGLQLIAKLKKLSPFTNFVVATGYPTIRTTKKALVDLQAMDYILKYPEDGSVFSLAEFRKTVSRAVESSIEHREQVQPNVRALIIEDEANWQETLSTVLLDNEYTVDVVSELKEAQLKIQEHMYHLVIVDLRLGDYPPQRGMELLGEIRKSNSKAILIVVSGWGTAERVRDAFAEYQVSDFLMKEAFSLDKFREAIKIAESARVYKNGQRHLRKHVSSTA
jgi:DNA-binding NtrC family response regulator